MPFLFGEYVEFALVAIGDKYKTDPQTAGRVRIMADGTLKVKPCDQAEWVDPRPEDLELFHTISKRYAPKG